MKHGASLREGQVRLLILKSSYLKQAAEDLLLYCWIPVFKKNKVKLRMFDLQWSKKCSRERGVKNMSNV